MDPVLHFEFGTALTGLRGEVLVAEGKLRDGTAAPAGRKP